MSSWNVNRPKLASSRSQDISALIQLLSGTTQAAGYLNAQGAASLARTSAAVSASSTSHGRTPRLARRGAPSCAGAASGLAMVRRTREHVEHGVALEPADHGALLVGDRERPSGIDHPARDRLDLGRGRDLAGKVAIGGAGIMIERTDSTFARGISRVNSAT